jgi:hypothetical protein
MAKHGKGACPLCGRMIALTPDGVVWRHDPKLRIGPVALISCGGSWEPHAGGPISRPGIAVQPSLLDEDQADEADGEPAPADAFRAGLHGACRVA